MDQPAAAPGSDPFRLPRLSRVRTRPRETAPGWSQWLAQFAFAALLALAIAGPWMSDQGGAALSQIRQAGYGAIFGLALVAIRPWQKPERLLVVPWPLLLALGWCALSLSWAGAPDVGLRRLVLTAIVLWSIFALVRQIGTDRAITILRVGMTLLLVVNYLVVALYPTIGIHTEGESGLTGDWRGIMDQKNFAGLTCAVTVLLFAFDAGRVPLALRIGVALASAVFLLLSDSATSLGMCIAALAVGALLAWAARQRGQRPLAAPGWAWLPFGLLAALFVHMALAPAPYLSMIADPAGFTGRYEIWTALIRLYTDSPWLGLGYGSLWDLGSAGPINRYARGWVAALSQGHNAYLDLLVQIGAIGTLVVLFATLVWPIQRLLRGGDQPTRALAAAMLLFCLGHNFTETTMFDRDTLGQVFLMIAIALLWSATAVAVAPRDAAARPSRSGRRRRSRD